MNLKKTHNISFIEVKRALYKRNLSDKTRRISPLQKHASAIVINSAKYDKAGMLAKMSKYVEKFLKINMATEQEIKTNPSHKEFQNLLDQDFKNRELKENQIIKGTVSEITKNFIVVDCKAKMEAMILLRNLKMIMNFQN